MCSVPTPREKTTERISEERTEPYRWEKWGRTVKSSGTWKTAEDPIFTNIFSYSCMCVQENGSIGLLYEALPNNCLCYTQFNLDWLLEK